MPLPSANGSDPLRSWPFEEILHSSPDRVDAPKAEPPNLRRPAVVLDHLNLPTSAESSEWR